jgi:hypothetical protein
MRRFLTAVFRFVTTLGGFLGRNARAITVFSYEGSETSFVSAGKTRILFESDGWISTPRVSEGGKIISIGIENPKKKDYWHLEFAAPQGAVISKGSFKDAMRYPFQPKGLPGLSFSGCHRGCNELAGEFTVLEAVFEGSRVISFAVDFIQYEEGMKEKWNKGSVRYNSRVPLSDIPTSIKLVAQ